MTNASAVARALRSGGLMTVPSRTREGIYVSGALLGVVSISVQIDIPSHARRLRDAVVEVLGTAGYLVQPNPHDDLLLLVSRKTPAEVWDAAHAENDRIDAEMAAADDQGDLADLADSFDAERVEAEAHEENERRTAPEPVDTIAGRLEAAERFMRAHPNASYYRDSDGNLLECVSGMAADDGQPLQVRLHLHNGLPPRNPLDGAVGYVAVQEVFGTLTPLTLGEPCPMCGAQQWRHCNDCHVCPNDTCDDYCGF